MNKREYNKQETIRMIRDSFILLCERDGLEHTTVAGLCKECGIAKSTFYLYFDDKFSVLDAIEKELLDSFREICYDLNDIRLDDVKKGKPLDKAVNLLRFMQENTKSLCFLLGKNGDQHFVYKWKKDIESSFLKRFETEKKNKKSAEIACALFSSGLIGIYSYIIYHMPDIDEVQLAIIIGNLLRYSLVEFDAFT